VGIEIQQADVAHLFPPQEVKNAFDEVTRAQTEIRTAVNRAEQEAQRRLYEAQSERYRMLQLAGAYAREQRVRAEAEASSFEQRLAQYRELKKKNPDFLRRGLLDEKGQPFAP